MLIGIISGLLVWVFTVWVYNMLTKPELRISRNWNPVLKRVYKWEKPQSKFEYKISSALLPIAPEISAESTTSVENAEFTDVLVGGPSFFFYGVTITNSKSKNSFFVRQPVEITKTILYVDGFDEVELRWWNYNNPKFEKLFPEQNDVSEKRRILIGAGYAENLVIAYRSVNSKSAYQFFSIDSDVGNNFWERQDYNLIFPPLDGVIRMYTTSGIINIRINISEEENHLVITEKNVF